jgi:hypothetical protein
LFFQEFAQPTPARAPLGSFFNFAVPTQLGSKPNLLLPLPIGFVFAKTLFAMHATCRKIGFVSQLRLRTPALGFEA